MPVSPGLLGLFVLAALLICVTPGPDMIYIATHGISQGTRQGVVASFGMATGMICHTTAVTLGLAGLVQASPLAYDVVRYGGAVYLAILGIRTLLEARAVAVLEPVPPTPTRSVFTRAAVTNLLNPKILLFYLAFLPQFTDPHRGPLAVQFLLLGIVFVVLGLAVDTAVALLSGRIGRLLKAKPAASRRLNEVAGVVFLGLAARLTF
jgi:threonine/homoserine/homoserine lactone efflux protein